MSRGQKQRTPANFPRMKHRAAARLRARWSGGRYSGGYRCAQHGIRWDWDNVDAAEMDVIENDIADHEDYHAANGEDDTCMCGCATGYDE